MLNRLVSDCITFGLKESEALQYRRVWSAIIKEAYQDRRAKLLSDDSHKIWADWFSKVGYQEIHKKQIDDVVSILEDSMHQLHLETHRKPNPVFALMEKNRLGLANNDTTAEPTGLRDERKIMKLKEDIRESEKLLLELRFGRPLITAVREREKIMTTKNPRISILPFKKDTLIGNMEIDKPKFQWNSDAI